MRVPSPFALARSTGLALLWSAAVMLLATRRPRQAANLVLGAYHYRRAMSAWRRCQRADRAVDRHIRRWERRTARPPRGRTGSGVPVVVKGRSA